MASTTTAVGSAALSALTSGTDNVAVGTKAGTSNSTGSDNVLIGHEAAQTLVSGDNNIVIGSGQDVPSSSISDYLNIGGVITGDMSSGAIDLIDGFTATTQSPGDNSTKLATTAYADAVIGGGVSSSAIVMGAVTVQWGSVASNQITNIATITFGTAFSAAPYSVVAIESAVGGTGVNHTGNIYVDSTSTTGAVVKVAANPYLFWIAIGPT
jgi:hypothetical protein